jgi:hypothetical protein
MDSTGFAGATAGEGDVIFELEGFGTVDFFERFMTFQGLSIWQWNLPSGRNPNVMPSPRQRKFASN